ncbi:uncharacterized protein cubi_00383 [Cryptosporidium ubiquitum]|uniref:Uncharacterized protein n=1 Tax=Cryptosporidium ubiquitum TaxID=857276 RepID=A0A1J4MHA8_9CRYT|nr:uncharacterized protein cubi_00383 [Cryptosporidium ubiquitum]OII72388.1 hypothetical protein cubi_00383 [Cryptosporidium ubiquitum]
MRNLKFSIITFIILFFCLFEYIPTIEGAEANDHDENESFEDEKVVHRVDMSSPTYVQISALETSVFERNLFVELIIKESLLYIVAIIKLASLFNPAQSLSEYLITKNVIVSINMNSLFDGKDEIISKSKMEEIGKLSKNKNQDLQEKVRYLLNLDSIKLFDLIAENEILLQEEIILSLDKLLTLMDKGVDRFSEGASVSLIYVLNGCKKALETFSKLYLNLSRKERSRKYILNKAYISQISLDSIFEEKASEDFDKKTSNSSDAQSEQMILCEPNLRIRNIYKLKAILKTTFSIVQLCSFVVFLFNNQEYKQIHEHIQKEEKILNKVFSKVDFSELSEQERLEMNLKARELLKFEKIQSYNFVSETFDTIIKKEMIIQNLKNIYRFLVALFVILKRLQTTGLDAFKDAVDVTQSLCDYITKRCAQEIKLVEALSEEKIYQRQLSTARSQILKKKEEYRQTKLKEAEDLKKEEKIRKQIERKQKDEREKANKELFEEAKKMSEKRKEHKKKTKFRRKFPILEDISDRSSGLEKAINTSLENISEDSPHPEVSSSASYETCKPKINRKALKLQKLQKEEQKSCQKEIIKKVIQEQKTVAISTKKRKQKDRKDKNENRREIEERERENERERQKQMEKERLDKMEHSNFMYRLVNSISSIEGLFKEAEKDTNLSSLIYFVLDLINREIEKEESEEENLSKQFSSISISDEASREDIGTTPRVGGRVRRRADEVPESAPRVSTAEFFASRVSVPVRRHRSSSGNDPSQISRPRSGSTSSRSRSRNRNRSKSRSRLISRSKSRGRSRSRSRNVLEKELTLTFDGFSFSQSSAFGNQENSQSTGKSKFMKYFFSSENVSKSDSFACYEEKYSSLKCQLAELSTVNEESTENEIVTALEICGNTIQELSLEVVPNLNGKEFFFIKLLEKSFIKLFVKFLILLKNKEKK